MRTKLFGLQLGHVGMDIELLLTGHPKYMLRPGEIEKKKVWYRCPTLAYVVEHPAGRILFDTGMSERWFHEWPEQYKEEVDMSEVTSEHFLESKLRAVGLTPESFDYVVVSHLHYDHAGGLRLFEKAGAEILVHEDEFKGVFTLGDDSHAFCRADYAFLPRKKPTLVYGEQELAAGVLLVSLPGHTWGSMGMLVHLERTGWVFLTSDALIHHEAYGPPEIGNMVNLFPDAWLRSIEKIRRYATRHEATLAPGHDEVGIKQRRDGSVEFTQLQYFPGAPYG